MLISTWRSSNWERFKLCTLNRITGMRTSRSNIQADWIFFKCVRIFKLKKIVNEFYLIWISNSWTTLALSIFLFLKNFNVLWEFYQFIIRKQRREVRNYHFILWNWYFLHIVYYTSKEFLERALTQGYAFAFSVTVRVLQWNQQNVNVSSSPTNRYNFSLY